MLKLRSTEAFDTVTVAVYVPTNSPVAGRIVKLPVPFRAMLGTVSLDSWKLSASLPDNETVNAPVADVPVLVIVIAAGVRVLYPKFAALNVNVPVLLSVIARGA
jgi:hypothetical protein